MLVLSRGASLGMHARAKHRGPLTLWGGFGDGGGVQKRTTVKSMFRPFDEEYQLGHTLGTGGYAVVRMGVHKATGVKYAVKIMKVGAAPKDPARGTARVPRPGSCALDVLHRPARRSDSTSLLPHTDTEAGVRFFTPCYMCYMWARPTRVSPSPYSDEEVANRTIRV